jgi:tRNA pseudouridine55 synthase
MRIDGILLLDKPQGLSSNQALKRAMQLVGADKGGHTGSLDPMATGMLPLCFGEATKIAGYLLGARKAYRARVRLGVTTATCDALGEVLTQSAVPALDDSEVRAHLTKFCGRIMQRAPEYSALKRDGVPLYKLARRGEVVETPVREVEIVRIELFDRTQDSFDIEVECGSGTYIRSLARDLGVAIGCGAHLSALRRLWVEPFQATPMVTLESLETARQAGVGNAMAYLLPMDAGLAALPRVDLDPTESARARHGNPTVRPGLQWAGLCRVYSADGAFVAIGERDEKGAVSFARVINP